MRRSAHGRLARLEYFCRLRTSFGGTTPLKTYKLNFRYDPYVG